MNVGELVVFVAGGLVLLLAGVRFARHFFSDSATWERRRRRSHAPIARQSKRPMVRFSVRTKSGRGRDRK